MQTNARSIISGGRETPREEPDPGMRPLPSPSPPLPNKEIDVGRATAVVLVFFQSTSAYLTVGVPSVSDGGNRVGRCERQASVAPSRVATAKARVVAAKGTDRETGYDRRRGRGVGAWCGRSSDVTGIVAFQSSANCLIDSSNSPPQCRLVFFISDQIHTTQSYEHHLGFVDRFPLALTSTFAGTIILYNRPVLCAIITQNWEFVSGRE